MQNTPIDRVINKTFDALTRLDNAGSASRRPLDKSYGKYGSFLAKGRNLLEDVARNYSSDHLAASPSDQNNFNRHRQNPRDGNNRPPYGTGIGGPVNYGYQRPYSASPVPQYGGASGSVGYAPDYYIAERRQLELIPAPPPRYIRQPVPVPYPVDRPVPQPYPVKVPQPVYIDRPVPVPVPQPVPVDRPVPCYVPVAVSAPARPYMVENSVSYKQRWVNG